MSVALKHPNYQYLHYFWAVARQGSIAAASRTLGVTPPTISVQLKRLEEHFGQPLFMRAGRSLGLTEVGRVAFQYAEKLFSIGRELQEFMDGRREGVPVRLDVGVAHVLPKLVTWRLLQPALEMAETFHLVCHEESPENLLSELVLHQVDVILSDRPLSPEPPMRVFNHPLGDSAVVLMATEGLAERYRPGFPRSLDGAPFLLPRVGTAMRRALGTWFEQHRVQPRIEAEFDDSALLKVAGEHGLGLFPVAQVVAAEARAHYRVEPVGIPDGVVERFYAVSAERQIEHPAVAAIARGARDLFGPDERGIGSRTGRIM